MRGTSLLNQHESRHIAAYTFAFLIVNCDFFLLTTSQCLPHAPFIDFVAFAISGRTCSLRSWHLHLFAVRRGNL